MGIISPIQLANDFYDQHKQIGGFTKTQLFSYPNVEDLSYSDFEIFMTTLFSLGMMELEEEDNIENGNFGTEEVNENYDRSQTDFEPIFARVMRIDPKLRNYIFFVRNIQAPQEGEEYYLLPLAKDGNPAAKVRLVEMFLKIVVRNALYFHDRYNISLQDAIQDGNVGLVKAIEKYKLGGAVRFSTYFPWWVRQRILRKATFPLEDKFRLPVNLLDRLNQHYINIHNSQEFKVQFDVTDYISVKELRNFSRISAKELDKYGYIFQPFIALSDIDDYRLRSFPAYSDWEKWELLHQHAFNIISIQIDIMLGSLKEREAEVLRYRHGLMDGEVRTLEFIAEKYGLTRERIRQIEFAAISRLRKSKNKSTLQGFLET